MPLATVRGAAIHYVVLGEQGPWVSLSPGGRRELGAVRSLGQRIAEAVREQIGGDEQRVHALQTAFDAIRFKHLLLPVWIYSYRWKGRLRQVVVNGHNGRVAGERPWSAWKIAGLVLGLAALAGLVALGVMQFQESSW